MMKKFQEILKENLLFDSHAHLDLPDGSIAGKIERAKAAEVAYVFNMGTKLSNWDDVLKISQDFPDYVIPSLGIHPEEADEIKNSEWENIIKLNQNKILMIGEIGLDYYWRQDNKETQKDIFLRQLQLAKELNLPVSVHVRSAYDDAFKTLQEVEPKSEVVLHSFTGTYDDLKTAIDCGYYLGANGIITYSGAKELKEAFKKYLGIMKDAEPVDFYKKHILFETDSPLLRPSNAVSSEKDNEPANVVKIFEYLKKTVRV